MDLVLLLRMVHSSQLHDAGNVLKLMEECDLISDLPLLFVYFVFHCSPFWVLVFYIILLICSKLLRLLKECYSLNGEGSLAQTWMFYRFLGLSRLYLSYGVVDLLEFCARNMFRKASYI